MEPNPEESSGEEIVLAQEQLTHENITALLTKPGYLVNETLTAANVGLKSIDDLGTHEQMVACASQLKVLVLRNNCLTSLPEQITQFSNLEHLDVSYNHVTSIPDNLGSLSKLKNLNIANNNITQLPGSITQLMQLNTLWIAHNDIDAIPSLSHISELKYILAAGTLMTSAVDEQNKSLFPADACIIELDTQK